MKTETWRALLNGYLSEGIHEVQGWCIPQLWQSIWPLAQRIGEGPVAEIGVYEGKFLIGLAKTFGCGPHNRAQALDVFDMQEFNIDKAGVGKMEVLRANFDAHGPFAFMSLLVTCNKIQQCSYFRLAEYLDTGEGYVPESHSKTWMKRVRRFGYKNLTVRPDLTVWQDLV